MEDLDTFIAIDVETSGFGKDAQILELGVVHFWKGKVVRRWSSLVCPLGLSFEDEGVKRALAVNQIPIESLMYQAFTFKKTSPRLELEIGEPLWVSQNAAFEDRMLRQEYARLGHADLPVRPELHVCTKELDLLLNPGIKGHKLEDLASRWGVEFKPTHRALEDAEACGHIFARMLDKAGLTASQFRDFYSRRQTLQWFKTINNLS